MRRFLTVPLSLALIATSSVAWSATQYADDQIPSGEGTLVRSEVELNQEELRTRAIAYVEKIRGRLYDDRSVLFNGIPLQDAVTKLGMTRAQYVSRLSWSTDIEKIAIQRAFENHNFTGLNHTRPDGSSWNTAVPDGFTGRASWEILAGGHHKGIEAAIDAWTLRELDANRQLRGYWGAANGHLHTIMDPTHTHFAMAQAGSVYAGRFGTDPGADPTGTNRVGTYGMSTTANPAFMSRLTGTYDVGPNMFLSNSWTSTRADHAYWVRGSGVAYAGDFTGTGVDSISLRDGNVFYIHASNDSSSYPTILRYGRAGDQVYVGDWNGDGVDTFAVRRGNEFYISNSLTSTRADVTIRFGRASDEVVVGDWNGDGIDTFAVRRGRTFFISNTFVSGNAETSFTYGRTGDVVLPGDWNGNGMTTLAVRRGNTYHVSNRLSGGYADETLTYGRATDIVVAGDWDGDRRDTLGVYRP